MKNEPAPSGRRSRSAAALVALLVMTVSIGVIVARRGPDTVVAPNQRVPGDVALPTPSDTPTATPGRSRVAAAAPTPQGEEPRPPLAGPRPGEPAPAGTCPGPRTCPRFVFAEGIPYEDAPVWPAGRNGVATVHYRINTLGALTEMSQDAMVRAIRAAFATWQAVVPGVVFVYDGTTLALPISGDGQNVVGFGDLTSGRHLGEALVSWEGRRITEADMVLAVGRLAVEGGVVTEGWTWLPCSGGEPCTEAQECRNVVAGSDIVVRCDHDLQNVVTHEVGHWLFLGDLVDTRDKEMTMYGTIGAEEGEEFVTERKKVTLARGDILGARALYPCDCPPPVVKQP